LEWGGAEEREELRTGLAGDWIGLRYPGTSRGTLAGVPAKGAQRLGRVRAGLC